MDAMIGTIVTDRVVVITGASRGIGRAAAIATAERGFRVVVGYASNKAAADEVVDQIERKNGKAIAVKCDVAHVASTQNSVCNPQMKKRRTPNTKRKTLNAKR